MSLNLFRTSGHFPIVVLAVVIVIYSNANFCDFVFDDVSAIKDNKDLRPASDLFGLFSHDFWGTPMSKEHSHKSYRPVCVLTFRLNYFFNELNPIGYHLVNVVLHAVVCILFHQFVASLPVPETVAPISTLLFAVHPIHTEAVTGIVGRAELLSSMFFLVTLNLYQTSTTAASVGNKITCYLSILATVALAVFSKEQGVTVLGICFVYELFFVQRLQDEVRRWISGRMSNNNNKTNNAGNRLLNWRQFVERTLVLVLVGAVLILVRLKVVMGSTLPFFTSFDNPAAHEPAPTKQLTWSYLIAKNFWLLLSPSDLCCDWTMGSIPLITSLADPRNLSTIIFVVGFFNVALVGLLRRGCDVVLLSIAIIAVPFLPASNLFFPVGFVIAERVLYIPSMGFSLLVAFGYSRIMQKKIFSQKFLSFILVFLLTVHSLKTFLRNFDWKDESAIFISGLGVNSNNAKLWNNVGHALESKGQFSEALKYFETAAKVQPGTNTLKPFFAVTNDFVNYASV